MMSEGALDQEIRQILTPLPESAGRLSAEP
jgi:hypothetical protein